jgi:hypothetical protein
MQRLLFNVLAGIVLILLLVLKRFFDGYLVGDERPASPMRHVFVAAVPVFVAFFVWALWLIDAAGYPVAALLLIAYFVFLLMAVARARRPTSPPTAPESGTASDTSDGPERPPE